MRAYTVTQEWQLIQFYIPEAHLKTNNNNKTKLDDNVSLQTNLTIEHSLPLGAQAADDMITLAPTVNPFCD